ncbi:MAG: RNA methyltransferase [Candidatus Methanomethylicota archaeon]|uniref:RNA methyltransferase n=1 Tax=Thermoproteota archaeon TaxID=2056631 RepID=A0A497EY37_9CREN|nr:MAG: RNA methyltransferase [Candidatus Verstraetearchaeota archaeon]
MEVYVILVEPECAGNVGFIARVMMNFGFKNLVIVNPKVELDGDARIFASHAVEVLENAVVVDSFDEAISLVDFAVGTTSRIGGDYNVLRVPITPKMLVERIFDFKGRVGLVFGRESIGLTNEELASCDLIVTIPASEAYPVLNVSHAVAIILYELFTYRRKFGAGRFREASRVEKEMLIKYFEALLEAIDYPEHKRSIAHLIFRHVIGRAFISGREAYTLMGVFRSALIKLGASLP